MATKSKKLKAAYEAVDRTKDYPLAEAVALVKGNASSKFDETIEIALNLGVDPRHSDQMVRGVVAMPNGTGKTTLIKEGMFDSTYQKTGKWNYYWPNKKIEKTGYYKQGKKDSIWKYYYLDGRIKQKGKFKSNVPDQEWSWWYNNNQLKRKETYINGKEIGFVYEYDSSGGILTKGKYVFGDREGEWYYIINDYMEEGSYIGGMKTGKWKTTYVNTNKTKFTGEYLKPLLVDRAD